VTNVNPLASAAQQRNGRRSAIDCIAISLFPVAGSERSWPGLCCLINRAILVRMNALRPPRLNVVSCLVFSLAVTCCSEAFAQQAIKGEGDLKKLLPRLPPVEPADAMKTISIVDGFRMELVAHEPAVSDPVDACFDADGRMYVAEMHGYPYSFEKRQQQPKYRGKKDAGVVRLLEDTNGDGRFDRSTRFADGITWPTSVCCYDGGVFVLAPPSLHYFRDTNGDGKADEHKVVVTGFGRHNVQSVANKSSAIPCHHF